MVQGDYFYLLLNISLYCVLHVTGDVNAREGLACDTIFVVVVKKMVGKKSEKEKWEEEN